MLSFGIFGIVGWRFDAVDVVMALSMEQLCAYLCHGARTGALAHGFSLELGLVCVALRLLLLLRGCFECDRGSLPVCHSLPRQSIVVLDLTVAWLVAILGEAQSASWRPPALGTPQCGLLGL